MCQILFTGSSPFSLHKWKKNQIVGTVLIYLLFNLKSNKIKILLNPCFLFQILFYAFSFCTNFILISWAWACGIGPWDFMKVDIYQALTFIDRSVSFLPLKWECRRPCLLFCWLCKSEKFDFMNHNIYDIFCFVSYF